MTPLTKVSQLSQKRVSAQSILRKSFVLTLQRHYLGNNRKIDLGEVVKEYGGEFSGDEDQFRAIKRLVDPKELRPVMRVQRKFRRLLRKRAIPVGRIFGESSYLIPSDDVEYIDAELEKLSVDLKKEAHVFAHEHYIKAVARQALVLGAQYDASDYSTPDEVEAAFSVDWNYVSFDAPDNLETVSQALFTKAKNRYESRMAGAYDEVRLVLRAGLRQVVAEIAEKLRPAEDGKPKVFRDSILNGLTEFFETFKIRNIADDTELGNVVQSLKKLTRGVDPENLRDLDAVREDVTKGITKAVKQLDGLVTSARRVIDLDAF